MRARTRDRGEETWRARRWFLGSRHQRERGNAKFVFARGGERGQFSACGRPQPWFKFWWGKESKRARVRVRGYMSEGRAGAGRRGWPRSGEARRAAC